MGVSAIFKWTRVFWFKLMWNKAELLYDKEGFEQLLQAFQKRLESTMITKKPTLFPKYVENVKI